MVHQYSDRLRKGKRQEVRGNLIQTYDLRLTTYELQLIVAALDR